MSAGDSIYMYRNLRPFFKFAVPQEKPDDGEVALWASAHAGQLKGPDLQRELANLKDAGVRLAPRSLDVLACEDVAAMNAMIDRSQGAGLTTPDYVSCTTTIASTEVDGAGQNLVVGTELGRLYVMDKTGTGVQTSVRLSTVDPSDDVRLGEPPGGLPDFGGVAERERLQRQEWGDRGEPHPAGERDGGPAAAQ